MFKFCVWFKMNQFVIIDIPSGWDICDIFVI